MYAKIDLTGPLLLETGPLPTALKGLSGADLADLSWCAADRPEFTGLGYWPVVDAPLPEHDPATEVPEPGGLTPDPKARVVRQGWTIRPLTAEEQEARLPPYRAVTKLEFVRLLTGHGGVTEAELLAARSDAALAGMWFLMELATVIERDDASTQAGLTGLVATGYLTETEKAAVLENWPR